MVITFGPFTSKVTHSLIVLNFRQLFTREFEYVCWQTDIQMGYNPSRERALQYKWTLSEFIQLNI